MTDKYQKLRNDLAAAIADAERQGGVNERAEQIAALLAERDALATAPLSAEPVYKLRVRGALHDYTPTTHAFRIPDGEHDLYLAAPVAAQAQPYSLNLDPAGIRALAADAITGALAFGAQGADPPPEGHWLTPFYEMGRQGPAFARFAEFIASDALAISYQSLGEYRTDLLRMLREAQTNTEGA